MKIRRRNNLLVEPPHSSTSDIAFILIIFFLVCASVQPDSGRRQTLPKSEEQPEKKQQSENPEVGVSRDGVVLNGNPMKMERFKAEILRVLTQKSAKWTRSLSSKVSLTPPTSDGLRFQTLSKRQAVL